MPREHEKNAVYQSDISDRNLPDKSPKKVVIVDDSWTVRAWLRSVIEEDARLSVVGEAESAEDARTVIKQTNPDVVTLDIQMPGMDGLDFLSRLMRLRPLPVVMISSTTRSNSEATITALSLGAVDCITKPTRPLNTAECRNVTKRIYSAACSRVHASVPRKTEHPIVQPSVRDHGKSLILIGASTGGVAALNLILADLNPAGPPVVIVQHMPSPFLNSFSQKLNQQLPQDVALAQENEVLRNGQIRLAPANGKHTEITRYDQQWRCRFKTGEIDALYCPSVDSLFHSATPYAPDILAIILTGLGRDGAEGMLTLHQAGAKTFGQDQESSVVYGMPRAASSLGAVQKQLPLDKIAEAVRAETDRLGRSVFQGSND